MSEDDIKALEKQFNALHGEAQATITNNRLRGQQVAALFSDYLLTASTRGRKNIEETLRQGGVLPLMLDK